MNSDLKSHWENIYIHLKMRMVLVGFKNIQKPQLILLKSTPLTNQFQLLILEVGEVEFLKNLIENEYENLTYLDISQKKQT